MQTVTVLAIGKLKESYLRDAVAEYSKRLAAFCKLQIIELAAAPLPQNPSSAEITKALGQEGDRLLQKAPVGAVKVALCIEGGGMTSEQFAQQIAEGMAKSSQLVFFIGGSHGLSPEVKAAADIRLSLSPMTFPHQLARVMLLEQLYRAHTIISGHGYHK